MKKENKYRVRKNGYGYWESEVKYFWFPYLWIPFITNWSTKEEEAWEAVKEKIKDRNREGKYESELEI